MTLDKKITLCENLTPVEVRIGNYIMNLEPLITEVINDNLNMYINDHLRMYTSDYALI